MSVVSWREILPRTFEHKLGSAPSATRQFNLTTDGPTPAQAILDSIGIYHGSSHPEYPYLRCTNGAVDEPDFYHATVTYTYELPQQNPNQYTPNPLQQPDVWKFSTSMVTQPAVKYFEGTSNGQLKPLTNSAGDIIEGVTGTTGELKVSITGNRANFPVGMALQVTGAVNSDNYAGAFPYTWLCQGISVEPQTELVDGNAIFFWRVSVNLVYRASGYIKYLPDIGMHVVGKSGKKERGTVYSKEQGIYVASSAPVALNPDGSQKEFGTAPDILERRLNPAANFSSYFGNPPL